MAELIIRTDNKWKDFVYRRDVPERVLNNKFDYLDEEEVDGFFKYQNTWYHTSMFERIPDDTRLSNWDGIRGTSFSTGILLKISRDGEQYKVGAYRVR